MINMNNLMSVDLTIKMEHTNGCKKDKEGEDGGSF